MTRRAALLAALLVVAGSTLAVAGVGTAVAQSAPGGEPPEETEDGATFTVSTQSLDLHQSEGGRICAQKLAPDVNKVTITEATMHGVELYLGEEGSPHKVSSPTADVDETVLYTNGENQLVNLLATTGACITLDQPQQTVLEVYYQETNTLGMDQFEYQTSGVGTPPEPGGFTLPASLLNNSSSNSTVPNATDALNRTTGAVGNATDTVQRVTDAVNGTTPTDAVDRVNETTENVTEVVNGVENPTETPGDALETVNDTTGTVTETVDGTRKTVNETAPTGTDAVDRTTETVDNATDAVEGTVNDTTDTVNDTVDSATGTPDRTASPVDDTRETAEGATTEVRDTVEDTTGDTQTAVEDTTTEVRTTAEKVVPPTAGFGLPADVPLVGEAVPLDASGAADSDGEIAKYEWDVDNDGDYEKTGRKVTHAFSSAGEKEVTLRVTDDDGATDTVTKTVPVNAPPTAAFSVVSDLLTIGEPISLDATKSSDPDGSIKTYEWDLDGDGNFEQTGATPSPTFDSLGTHEIALRVTDSDGATDTVTKTIDLTESDDGGLLSGSSSDGGSTTTDSGGSTTTTSGDDGDDTSIIGAILP